MSDDASAERTDLPPQKVWCLGFGALRYELPQNSQEYDDGNKRLALHCTSTRNNTFVYLAKRQPGRPGHHMIRAHKPHPIIFFTLS